MHNLAARRDRGEIARKVRRFVWNNPHLNPLPSLACRCCMYGFPDDKKIFESLWCTVTGDAKTAVPTPTRSRCTKDNPCGATLTHQCDIFATCGNHPLPPPIKQARADKECFPSHPCRQEITAVCTRDHPCCMLTITLNIDHRRPGFAVLRQDGSHIVQDRLVGEDEDDGRVYIYANRAILRKFELPEVAQSRLLLTLLPPQDEITPVMFSLGVAWVLFGVVLCAASVRNPLAVVAILASAIYVLVSVVFPGEIDRRWNRYICGY